MDFSLPEEILKYKLEAKEWVEKVLDPLSVPLEEEERIPPELVEALRKGRFFGLTIPKEYGGQGWKAVEWFTVLEELSKAYATVRLIAHTMNGLFWRPSALFRHGRTTEKISFQISQRRDLGRQQPDRTGGRDRKGYQFKGRSGRQ